MAVLNQSPSSQASSRKTQVVRNGRMTPEQKKQVSWLQARMRKVKNQMDFVEIISNFLPVGVMDGKVDRLDKEMKLLNQQYASVLNTKSPFSV